MNIADPHYSSDVNLKSRGFGGSIGFGSSPALLVIDMMVGFTNPELPLGSNLDRQVIHINKLVDAAHRAGHPVFYSVVEYDDADCRDSGIWGRKMSGLFTLKKNSESVSLDPRLVRRSADSVFVKKYASCFFGTDFSSRLQSQRVDTLIITGCSTSGCVRATVVDAVQHGFRPIVPFDAVGDRLQAAHEQTLRDIDLKYGDVISIEDALRSMAGLQRESQPG